MYEIRKRSTTHPDVWYPVAWSDMRAYAVEIAELMNIYGDAEFDVFETNTPSISGGAGRGEADLLTEARILGNWKPGSTPCKRGGHAGGKRLEVAVDMTKDLELMDRDELKQYAREKGIRLYTVVPEKMRKQIREIEYARAHRGDAFRDL